MTKYWIAVASRAHVQRGMRESFMQVCHGKSVPLQRLRPKDGVIYYSPSHETGQSDGLQSFTALALFRTDVSIKPIWAAASSLFAGMWIGVKWKTPPYARSWRSLVL